MSEPLESVSTQMAVLKWNRRRKDGEEIVWRRVILQHFQ
jgi:hypothetical protein